MKIERHNISVSVHDISIPKAEKIARIVEKLGYSVYPIGESPQGKISINITCKASRMRDDDYNFLKYVVNNLKLPKYNLYFVQQYNPNFRYWMTLNAYTTKKGALRRVNQLLTHNGKHRYRIISSDGGVIPISIKPKTTKKRKKRSRR